MRALRLLTVALQAMAGERTVRDLSFDESLGYSEDVPSRESLPEKSLLMM